MTDDELAESLRDIAMLAELMHSLAAIWRGKVTVTVTDECVPDCSCTPRPQPEVKYTVPVTAGQDDPDGARAWLDAQAEQAGQTWGSHRK